MHYSLQHGFELKSEFDSVIACASVYDGSGQPSYIADIGISGDKIAAIAPAGSLRGKHCIAAENLALAPGFIDVHTHDDREVLCQSAMLPKLTQGVTTVITGNCGISLAPWLASKVPPAPLSLIGDQAAYRFTTVAEYVAAITQASPAVNVAVLIGHSTLRVNVMPEARLRTEAASPAETLLMQNLLEEGMQAGALGFSSGLFYQTSKAAGNTEVIALAKISASAGGVYTSHIRDEYNGVIEALAEACDAAQAAQLPVILSHHKCAGPANWGRSPETLAYITKRRSSQKVGLDAYPYPAGSTVLDPDYVDGVIRIMISFSEPYPELAGRDLSEIAENWGVDQKTAARRLHPAGAVYFQMREDDVQNILRYPHTMIGSDGLPHDSHPHPRLWGTFPRVLGHYARDLKLFSLSEAIHRMTQLSADQFGLSQRGRIAVGCNADLVVFDPETVTDVASFANPKQAAKGIIAVFVNGTIALENCIPTGKRGGRFLKRQDEKQRPATEPLQ